MSEEIENKETSFAVVITPEFGEDGKWTGIVGCHMEEEVNHDLSDEELIQILDLYSAVQLNETIPEILKDNIEDLLEPIQQQIKEKYNIYSNINKRLIRKIPK